MTPKSEKLAMTLSRGNVFADMGLPEAEKYLAKAELARQIGRIVKQRHVKQVEAATILGIDQPKISALLSGRLDGFSIERLIGFLNTLDCDVDIIVKPKSRPQKIPGHLRVGLA